ncbi:MAG: NAD(P)/FAD-dependent oxidoreductase [Gillisia sp.]
MTKIEDFDVIIIGGSYAGLSAALSLGRALRKTLVIDSGTPCNEQTPHSHNFLTRDGETPGELSGKAKKEVMQYPSVHFEEDRVVAASKNQDHFKIQTEEKKLYKAKKLIFATGLIDIIPEIAGFAECWGISILHCPYCHGFENKNVKTGVFANGQAAYDQAKFLSNWTKELTVFTDGKSTLTAAQTANLKDRNIPLEEKEIEGFEHNDGHITNIVFKDGSKEPLKALYATPEVKQQTELPEELGCEFTEHGRIEVDIFQKTNVEGVYAAGDNSSMGRSVAVAVAAGSVAGMLINKEIIEDEFSIGEEIGNPEEVK